MMRAGLLVALVPALADGFNPPGSAPLRTTAGLRIAAQPTTTTHFPEAHRRPRWATVSRLIGRRALDSLAGIASSSEEADPAGQPLQFLHNNGHDIEMDESRALKGTAVGNGHDHGTSNDHSQRAEASAGGIIEATAKSVEAAAKSSVPLKVMVFVDGTWLYYSFFERGDRCLVTDQLGPGWQFEYRVKWEMLPVIISRALHAQLAKYHSSRLVDVVRTVVFSSARKDTDKDSSRMQMFTHMRDKTNFEVHMATTMGVQEKCIDIALAVEMMHYATIPDTYDVGVLVTGDKDFMPAMSRTRQKGRRVCLCSMRNSCNNDLLRDDAHVMDFDPVWINEYLEEMMEHSPPDNGGVIRAQSRVPAEMLCEIIFALMADYGGTIGSRDLGRELNKISVLEDRTKALTVIKETWGNLSNFLYDQNDMFQVGTAQADPEDPSIRQFIVSLMDKQNSMKSVKLGEVMDEVSAQDGDGASDDAEYGKDDGSWDGSGDGGTMKEEREETVESLSSEKITDLKERLRNLGLPVSGKKAVLVERILTAMAENEVSASSSPMSSSLSSSSSRYPPRPALGNASSVRVHGTDVGEAATAAVAAAVGRGVSKGGMVGENIVKGVSEGFEPVTSLRDVHAALVTIVDKIMEEGEEGGNGGVMSSRDLGRELAKFPAPDGSRQSALSSLKNRWTSLVVFLRACPMHFEVCDIVSDEDREFGVARVRLRGRQLAGERGGGAGGKGGDEPRRPSVARSMTGAVGGGGGLRGLRDSREGAPWGKEGWER